jgi:transcription elongation factor Elf1
MNRNNFFAFISSKDENDILTVKYETKTKETVTEQFKHKKLHACPFCGGKARLIPLSSYGSPCVKVQCEHCRSCTVIAVTGQDMITKKFHDWLDVLSDVIKRWNTRTHTA